MARKRKVKIKEPVKLWEVPAEEIEKEIERLAKLCPNSGYLKVLRSEIAREDRSKPQHFGEENEQDLPSGSYVDERGTAPEKPRKRRSRKTE